MRKKLLEMSVSKISSLRALEVKHSSARTLFLALFIVLGMSSAWADDVASVTFDGTTTMYSSFRNAIDYANNLSSTEDNQALVTVLEDCVNEPTTNIEEGKYIKISGGSHTLEVSTIIVYGNLTVIDGTYTSQNKTYSPIIDIHGKYASLTVNGGTIDGTNKENGMGIVQVNGTCKINGGVIKGKMYGAYLQSSAQSVELNGGTFYGGERSIISSLNTISVDLGSGKAVYQLGDNGWESYTGDYASTLAFSKTVHVGSTTNVATVTVNSTEHSLYDSFNAALDAANNAGNATLTLLSDCSINNYAYIYSNSNITLNGGSYTLTTSESIHVNGHLTINDGTYVSTTTSTEYCIYVQGGSLTLNGGTFCGSNTCGSIEVFGKTVLSALGEGKMYYDGDDLYKGNLLSAYIGSQVTVKDASSYTAVIYTGTSNIGCETFAKALSNVQQFSMPENPYKIILLKDCETAGFEAPDWRSFYIYGNKHTMTLTDKVQVRGDLIIGDGTFKAADSYDWKPSNEDTDELFDVTGTLTIEGGVIDANHVMSDAIETSSSSGDVKINGGTIQGANRYALYIFNAGTGSVLTRGSLSANTAAIHVPSPMPVCYLLRYNSTFENYNDDFFASVTSSSVNIVAGDILYKRDVTSGNYGSICLPFYSNTQSGIKAVYEVASVSADNVELKEAENWGSGYKMEAGTPYIFKSNASSICIYLNSERLTTPVTNDYLVGNFDAMTETTYVPVGNYVLQNNSFKKVTSATADDHIYSGSFRCYLKGSKVPSSSSAKADILNIDDEPEATAVDALNAVMNNSAVIYDVNGRRLQSLQKGVNIVNGKKISVK